MVRILSDLTEHVKHKTTAGTVTVVMWCRYRLLALFLFQEKPKGHLAVVLKVVLEGVPRDPHHEGQSFILYYNPIPK